MSQEDEVQAQALFKKWEAQQSAMMGGTTNLTGDMQMGPDQSPHLTENMDNPTSPDQSPTNPINSVRPMGAPISKAPPMDPNLIKNAGGAKNMGGITQPATSPGGAPTPAQMPDVCKECGTMHPPIKEGETCPNAGASIANVSDNPDALDDAAINKHLVDMRNIIMTQITSKGIKNQKKFFQSAIVELTMVLEKYNE